MHSIAWHISIYGVSEPLGTPQQHLFNELYLSFFITVKKELTLAERGERRNENQKGGQLLLCQ